MKVLLAGRYNSGEKLSGPEKFQKRIFEFHCRKSSDILMIDNFFKKEGVGIYERFVGFKELDSNIFRIGWLRLLFFILTIKPDIIHICSSERYLLPLILIKKIFKFKLIATVHEVFRKEDKHKPSIINKFYERILYKNSEKLVFVSELARITAQKYYYLKPDQGVIIPNGIDDIFKKNKINTIKDKKIKVVFYNGFSAHINRNFNELIPILREQADFNYDIYILGEPVNLSLNSSNVRIINAGVLNGNELAEFLTDKNLFLKSISFDTFSIITGEAMAAGLIPVIPDITGISSFINNGINGYVYYSQDINSLKKILSELSRIDFEYMSANCSMIKEKLNWESVSNQYFEIYKLLYTKK